MSENGQDDDLRGRMLSLLSFARDALQVMQTLRPPRAVRPAEPAEALPDDCDPHISGVRRRVSESDECGDGSEPAEADVA